MIHVIALCGRAGSGKSTAAELLSHKHGIPSFSFAGPIKEMARDVMRFSEEQLYGTQVQKERPDGRYKMSPRVFLQRLGVAAREHLGKNIWSDTCIQNIIESGANIAIIDDLRFISEAQSISSKRDITPYIIRLHASRMSQADALHPSEAEVDLIPDELIYADVYNDRSSFDSLLSAVEASIDVPGIKSSTAGLDYRRSLRDVGKSRSKGEDMDSRNDVCRYCSAGLDGDTIDCGSEESSSMVLDRPFFRNGGDFVFGSLVDEVDREVISRLASAMVDKGLLEVSHVNGEDRALSVTPQLMKMIRKWI